MELSQKARQAIAAFQTNEITEYHVYKKLAARVKNEGDRATLIRIAEEEKAHAAMWRKLSGDTAKPRRFKIAFMSFLGAIFGYTFALKLMENGENGASGKYEELSREVPVAKQIAEDEQRHENELIGILNEDRLNYVGSMVLGLNDALVELTGTLAGLSLAMQNTRLIALSGLITGIAATLSMASSEYLSAKSDGDKNPFKSCVYTGVMYILAVALLVLPYLLYPEEMFIAALVTMLAIVVVVIFVFTYYISVAKGYSFKKRFLEMAGISLSVAAVSFVIGILVKQFLGVDI